MPKTKPGWTTINKQQLEIIYRDPADLLPYARNAKIHTDSQIEKLAKGIVEYGFTDPIAIDENGEIVAGHGRLLAAKKLNLKSVPTVQLLGWTEAQKVAYRNFHNKITLETDFDPDLLKLDMDFLSEMDFDLELTGWDSEDLSSYLETDTTEYQVPERQDYEPSEKLKNSQENQLEDQNINDGNTEDIDTSLQKEQKLICPHCGKDFVIPLS